MHVEFDPQKSVANLKKHGVSLGDAEPVFYDELARTRQGDDVQGETRLVTIGMSGAGQLPVVVWTPREQGVRVISARPASRNERRAYESKL